MVSVKKVVVTIVACTVLASPLKVHAANPDWKISAAYHEVSEVHQTPHKGIDYAIPIGTKVQSYTGGKVVLIKDSGDESFGKHVKIRTIYGYEVIYAHLSQILVKEGDQIKVGDVIALSGNTGRSTGPHLHVQVNYRDEDKDPNFIVGNVLAQALIKKHK